MIVKVPEVIKEASKTLRKNMTFSEKRLWLELRCDKIGVRFLRQKPLYLYTENSGLDRFIIPDFYCHEKKLVIEADGSIHDLKEVLELDIEKEKLLNNLGIKVLRIKNEDIQNDIKNVVHSIKKCL